ncbi:MAG: beta-galactosidase, partial [Tepidisphaeraceae bacterium]
MTNAFHYGVCYFPEHWPADWVPDDLSRIRDAGFTYIRIGEGAWAYFEPQEGQFRFDLFDSVVKAADERGLKIIFGTPTYCGPAWIGATYPEVYRWDFNRTPMKHGGRRNYTYTSPRYLELSDRIVTALATHYRRAKPII